MAPGPFRRHSIAAVQVRRRASFNPRPSQRSGLSSTSGASERSVVGLSAEGSSVVVVCAVLVTLMRLLVAEVSPVLETWSV